MIDSCDYTPDGKFLVLPKFYPDGEPIKVPVSLVDELIERRLSSYDVERLIAVRNLTRDKTYRKANIADLVGEDLTGKTLDIYFLNYEDSEIMSTNQALSVKEDGGYYSFVFPAEITTCYEDECTHANKGRYEDCASDDLYGYSFQGYSTVLITEQEPNDK